MPSLQKNLAAVQAAITSLLWPTEHSGSLYSVNNTANALNIAANIDGNHTISTAVTKLISTHTRDIKMPNFVRWMTIFPALYFFLDN